MRLTRRDALAAGVGATAAGVVGVQIGSRDWQPSGRETLTSDDIASFQAVADVVYPSEIETTTEFVETYTDELYIERRRGITAAIDDLNDDVQRKHGRRFESFDLDRRRSLLEGLGVHRSRPIADGTVPERIRFYLVNGLLYALFTTPTGTQLLGIDNPLGYPGGHEQLFGGWE